MCIRDRIGSTCGSMGYSIPASVSSALVFPQKKIISFEKIDTDSLLIKEIIDEEIDEKIINKNLKRNMRS